jgi:hypothetical protein
MGLKSEVKDKGCKHSSKCIDCPLEKCEKEVKEEKLMRTKK